MFTPFKEEGGANQSIFGKKVHKIYFNIQKKKLFILNYGGGLEPKNL